MNLSSPPKWIRRLPVPSIRQLLVALLTVGIVWRGVRFALGFPFWGDEAFVGVDFLLRDYGDMIRPSEYGQIVPLLFMWIQLAISRALGCNEWSLRVIPFLAGIASLLLFWRFAHQVLNRRAAMLATGFLAVAHYPVRHATELKPYATDLLISLLLTITAWGVCQRPGSMGRWMLLISLAGIAPWASYPSVFVAGGAGIVWAMIVIRNRFSRPQLPGITLYGLVLCASFAAMYFIYALPHAQFASRLTEIVMWIETFPPLAQPLRLVAWLFSVHTGNMLAYPVGGRAPGSVVTLVLVVVGGIRLWRLNRWLLLLLLMPLPLNFVAAALHAYPYGGSARVSLYMAPAICLLAGLGLQRVLHRMLNGFSRRIGLALSGEMLAVIGIVLLIKDIREPFKSEADLISRTAVRTLAVRAAPADRWIVFNSLKEVSYAPWLGAWRGTGSVFVFDVMRYAPVPVQWAPPPETIAAANDGRVWLLAYRGLKVAFPEDQFVSYRTAMEALLGAPRHETIIIKQVGESVEALEIYEFPSPSGS